ncbi:hypothetical protein GGI07_005684, partial [Coemansia sp. Benny D115]
MAYRAQASDKLTRPMTYFEAEEFKKLQSMAFEYDNYLLPLFPSLHSVAPQATKISQMQCIPILGNLYYLYISLYFIMRTTNINNGGSSTVVQMLGYTMFMFIVGFIPFVNVWVAYKMNPLYRCWLVFSERVDVHGLYYGVSKSGMRTEYLIDESLNESSGMHHLATPPSSNTPLRAIPYEGPSIPEGQMPPAPTKENGGKHYSVDSIPANRRGYSSFIPVPVMPLIPDLSTMPAKPAAVTRLTMAESEYTDFSTRRHSFDSMRASTIPDEADFLLARRFKGNQRNLQLLEDHLEAEET